MYILFRKSYIKEETKDIEGYLNEIKFIYLQKSNIVVIGFVMQICYDCLENREKRG